jgi:hypothetical protein
MSTFLVVLSDKIGAHGNDVTAKLTGGPVEQIPRGANLQGGLRRHWNNRKYGASKLRFLHSKELFQKLPAIWASAVKKGSPGLSYAKKSF